MPTITVSMETNAELSDPLQPLLTDPQSDSTGSIFSSVEHLGYGGGPGYPVEASAFQNDEGASAVSSSVGYGGFLIADEPIESGDVPLGAVVSNLFTAQSSALITYTVENTTGVSLINGEFDYLVNEATLAFSDTIPFLDEPVSSLDGAALAPPLLPTNPPLPPGGDAAAGYRYTLSLDGVEQFKVGAEMIGLLGGTMPSVIDENGDPLPPLTLLFFGDGLPRLVRSKASCCCQPSSRETRLRSRSFWNPTRPL